MSSAEWPAETRPFGHSSNALEIRKLFFDKILTKSEIRLAIEFVGCGGTCCLADNVADGSSNSRSQFGVL